MGGRGVLNLKNTKLREQQQDGLAGMSRQGRGEASAVDCEDGEKHAGGEGSECETGG